MSPERREPSGAGMAASREISCVRCGALIKPGKKFCSHCGSPVAAVVIGAPVKPVRRPNICPECSFENHHSDLFCKGCGIPLTDSPSAPLSHDSTQRSAIGSPSPEAVEKTDVTVPSLSNEIHQSPDLPTDVAEPLLIAAASSLEDVAKADGTAPLIPHHESHDLRPDGARSLLGASAAPSSDDAGKPETAIRSEGAQLAEPARGGPRAAGIAALGVGLVAVLVALIHFHRSAGAQAKQFSITTTAFTTRTPSPMRAGLASAVQRLASPGLNSGGRRGQDHKDRRPPSLAPSMKSLENTDPQNVARGVPKQADSGVPKATADSEPEPEVQSAVRSVPITIHSEALNEVASANEKPQPPTPLPEVSRQDPTTLPSSTPENVPAETNPALVSAAASGTNGAERASVVQPAKFVSRPALRYPSLALEARVQGDVHLEANVLADGTVASVRIVSGILMLNDAALSLAKNSRYRPALVDGRPVRSYVDVTISFRLPH